MGDMAFILPDGTVVEELPPDQMDDFKQKVLDLFTPMLYEYEMRKLAEEYNRPPGTNE